MTRGGHRPGSGQPPTRGQPQTERMTLRLTEAERAEIYAAVPDDAPVGPWIVERAQEAARGLVPRDRELLLVLQDDVIGFGAGDEDDRKNERFQSEMRQFLRRLLTGASINNAAVMRARKELT